MAQWKVTDQTSVFADAEAAVAAAEQDGEWRLPSVAEVTTLLVESADKGYSFSGALASVTSLWVEGGKLFNLPKELLGVDSPSTDTTATIVLFAPQPAITGPAVPSIQRLVVSGYMDSPVFQQCVEATEYLHASYASEYDVSITREFAFEFEKTLNGLVAQGKPGVEPGTRVLVANSDTGAYESGEAFIKRICATTDFKLFQVPDEDPNSYRSLAQESFLSFLRSNKSDFCWITVRIGEQFAGRIVFRLFSDLCPRTCENFLHLCKGDLPDVVDSKTGEKVKLTYKGTSFFRVVAGGWIQAGDIAGNSGTDGHSIYGRRFPDECFTVKHDEEGILGMANEGEHTNNSQFYVTLAKAGWMDQRYVAFGRVVEGLNVMQAIGSVETRHNQTPKEQIVIDDCGYIPLS